MENDEFNTAYFAFQDWYVHDPDYDFDKLMVSPQRDIGQPEARR